MNERTILWICAGLVFIMVGNMTIFQFCGAILKALGSGGSAFLQEAGQSLEERNDSSTGLRPIPTGSKRRASNLSSTTGNQQEDLTTLEEIPDLDRR